MNVKQCSEFWQFSISWIYKNWRSLQGFKISSRIRFNKADQERLREKLKDSQKSLTFPSHFHTLTEKGVHMTGKSQARHIRGFGSIYRRKKGKSWTIDFYENGKRIQRIIPHARSMEEAFHVLVLEAQRAFDKRYGVERRRREIGFETFAQSFLNDYMKTSRRNFQSDVYRLNELSSYFSDTDLRSITPLTVERFRKSRLKAGNTKSTCNRYLALMKKMFNTAIEEGYVEQNPVTKVKFYSEKDTVKERILTEEEEERLYEASADYLRPILVVALTTGMRKGEILNLKWNQIDLKNRRIRVEKTKNSKLRFIPVNDTLFHELSVQPHEDGVYVFANPATGKPYVDVKRQFKNACKRAGIQGLRFQDIRHSFASHIISAGTDIETVRDLLGHQSITTTQRYTHSNDERKRKAVESLDEKAQIGDNLVTIRNQSKAVN